MQRWAYVALIACLLPRFGAAQTGMEILEKVAAAYGDGAPLDIEYVERNEFRSPGRQNIGERTVRAVQSGHKTRLDEGGVLSISDGVHNWQYNPGSNEYTQRDGWTGGRLGAYASIATGVQSARLVREEDLKLQGADVPCYVVDLERVRRPNPAVLVSMTPERLWIDKARYLVLKSTESTTLRDPGGETNESVRTIEVTRAKAGGPLADSLFEFKPPPGARLVDRISSRPPSPLLGKAFPDLDLRDTDGKPLHIKDHLGKLTVVHFDRSFNLGDNPFMELLYRAFHDRSLAVWNVLTPHGNGTVDTVPSGYTMPTLTAPASLNPVALRFPDGVLTRSSDR